MTKANNVTSNEIKSCLLSQQYGLIGSHQFLEVSRNHCVLVCQYRNFHSIILFMSLFVTNQKIKMQSNCSHGHSSNQFLIRTCSANWMQYVFCSSDENAVIQRGLNELAKEAVPKERGSNTNIPIGQIRACSSVFCCLALKFSEFL